MRRALRNPKPKRKWKPIDDRKFGYDVGVLRPSLQTLGVGVKNSVGQGIDCKTVGFLLKISKEIGKAWRKESYTREAREPQGV